MWKCREKAEQFIRLKAASSCPGYSLIDDSKLYSVCVYVCVYVCVCVCVCPVLSFSTGGLEVISQRNDILIHLAVDIERIQESWPPYVLVTQAT